MTMGDILKRAFALDTSSTPNESNMNIPSAAEMTSGTAATPLNAPKATCTPPATSTGLLGAAKAIQEQRAADYDQPSGERSMGKTIAAFNAVTGRTGERALSEADGWLLMCVLKMVRDQAKGTTAHRDSIEDLVSYSSLYGEARLKVD